jgi:hypothetical protein
MISAAEWQLGKPNTILNELMFGTTALLVNGYHQQGF